MADVLLIILFVAIAIASNAKKKKSKSKSGVQPHASARPASRPIEKSKIVPETASEDNAVQVKFDTFDHGEKEESWRGSIEMMPEEPHVHEGKDPESCPAAEREKDRADAKHVEPTIPASNAAPGLTLNFSDGQSILQGVVMSEVLRRPEFVNGHRVIR
jgi:hypothetical protein